MSDDFSLDGDAVDLNSDLESIGVAEPVAPKKRATRSRAAAVEQPAAMPEATVKGEPIIFFDIETVPDEERMASFDLPELPPIPEYSDPSELPNHVELLKATVAEIVEKLKSIVAPKSYLEMLVGIEKAGKNRDGVYKAIAAAGDVRGSVEKLHADRIKLLSTTPEYCKIVSMAVCRGDEKVTCSVVGQSNSEGLVTEEWLLRFYWDALLTCPKIAGYNIAGFDLPVIYFRSALLGVRPSKKIDATPWKDQVLDLYRLRFPGKDSRPAEGTGRLKQQAALCGIPIPAGETDGGAVYELWKAKKLDEINAYNVSDVEITRAYWRKFKGFFW